MLSFVSKVIDSIYSIKEEQGSYYKFVPSYSFCQARWLFENMIGDLIKVDKTFLDDYYEKIGLAVHNVIQRWLAKTGILYGKWRCHGRPKLGVGPFKCSRCGKTMTYVELELRDGGLIGRPDAILVYKDGYFILEFKTTSLLNLDSDNLPYPSHVNQANSYSIMLEKTGKKVYGFSVVYIARDNPRSYKYFVTERSGFDYSLHEMNLRLFEEALQMLKTGNFSSCRKLCEDGKPDPNCKYRYLCEGNLVSNLEGMFKNAKVD